MMKQTMISMKMAFFPQEKKLRPLSIKIHNEIELPLVPIHSLSTINQTSNLLSNKTV